MATSEEMHVPQREDKIKHLESMLGPILTNAAKFDDFQLTLFDLISNASDDGIQQCFQHKTSDIHKFLLTLFIASLHRENPLRLANDASTSKLFPASASVSNQDMQSNPKNNNNNNNKENPLHSVLVTPSHTLPPPPKRRDSTQTPKTNPQEDGNDKQVTFSQLAEPQKADDPKKNNNVASFVDVAFLERNLSGIDEMKEKDKYMSNKQQKQSKENEANSIWNSTNTPNVSDDKLVTQSSLRNKNMFDDILTDNDNQTDTEMSKTYDDDFFAQRTITTREHTTTEKFQCNPKERAIVDEWRLLLHGVKASGMSPAPPVDGHAQELMANDDEKGDDGVIVKSAEEIKEELDDQDILLIEPAEMIAPMTRIRGKLKLTSTSITFIPDQDQASTSFRNKDEINLATNPPPLPMSPHVNSSRARTASYGLINGNGGNKYISKLNLNQSLSNAAPSVTPSAHLDMENDTNLARTPKTGRSGADGEDNFAFDEKLDAASGGNQQYWVTTSVCSSYQQVGGTRYRLMTAHRFWFIDELREIYYRRYQLRNCAFELFFSDDTSWLFNLYDEQKRDMIFNKIMSLSPTNLMEKPEFFQNPKRAIKASQIHHKWCRREITNFEYLMRLNILAGRTFNDLTQYPVVPWVITDFESDSLDINDEKIYRDLSKPIGALNEERLQKFIDRYESLEEDYNLCPSEEEKSKIHCFMYGTHYSSIGIILYYLLRMEPFTTYNLKFQGGKFDQPDRLFFSVSDTWNGCLKNTSDVKELIPEFYYLTDFLSNKQNLELGMRQNGKSKVDDVELPPWCKQSPEKFVKMMREALESEYVSNHLHEWIDLIFGYKQRGADAVKANNVFHPYTYEGEVDIDKIEDPTERRAILSQIDEFGQTPLQLFTKPHPRRLKRPEVLTTIFKARSVKYYSKQHLTDSTDIGIVNISWLDKQVIVVGSDCCIDVHKWEQSKLSIEKKKNSSISKMMKFGKKQKQDKIGQANFCTKITHRNLCFATTKDGQYTFACGFEDNSFVVWDIDKAKLHQGIHKHNDIVSCLALDEDVEKHRAILVTGSYDKSVMVWRVNINAKQRNSSNKQKKKHHRKNSASLPKITYTDVIDTDPTHILDNQLAAVVCVDVSIKSGIIVCCSLDGIANVYNASTGEHYHMLQPYIDKAMRLEQRAKEKEERKQKEKEKEEEEQRRKSSPIANGHDETNNTEQKAETDEKSPEKKHSIVLVKEDATKSTEDEDEENRDDEDVERKETDMDLEEDDEYDENMENPVISTMNTMDDNDTDYVPFKPGSIPSGELTIVRVSHVFGHVLCYSKQTKDIFLYSSTGELQSWSNSRDDIYYDVQFSKTGNHIVCGGTETVIRVKELPSFRTRKKFEDPNKPVRTIYLDKDETYMLVGTANGNVLVYSLPQKAFVKSRVHTLTELGF